MFEKQHFLFYQQVLLNLSILLNHYIFDLVNNCTLDYYIIHKFLTEFHELNKMEIELFHNLGMYVVFLNNIWFHYHWLVQFLELLDNNFLNFCFHEYTCKKSFWLIFSHINQMYTCIHQYTNAPLSSAVLGNCD